MKYLRFTFCGVHLEYRLARPQSTSDHGLLGSSRCAGTELWFRANLRETTKDTGPIPCHMLSVAVCHERCSWFYLRDQWQGADILPVRLLSGRFQNPLVHPRRKDGSVEFCEKVCGHDVLPTHQTYLWTPRVLNTSVTRDDGVASG